jgi:hypothetical protein
MGKWMCQKEQKKRRIGRGGGSSAVLSHRKQEQRVIDVDRRHGRLTPGLFLQALFLLLPTHHSVVFTLLWPVSLLRPPSLFLGKVSLFTLSPESFFWLFSGLRPAHDTGKLLRSLRAGNRRGKGGWRQGEDVSHTIERDHREKEDDL